MISTGILVVMMTMLWAIAMRIRNAALVDAGWGFGYAVVAIVSLIVLDGVPQRQLLITIMVSLWGIRLGWHLLADRILGGKPEEGRYADMRKRWQTALPLKFFLFYQAQAFLIVFLSIPVYLISLNPSPELSWVEWVGFVMWLAGIVGETVADRQLKKFKDNPDNRGRTCQAGLWRYSRHPNYFFEWIIWVGYFVMALSAPYGWLAAISPAAILFFLLRVTGIPLTEIQAVKSRGNEYRVYQQTTSPFIPWFRKEINQ